MCGSVVSVVVDEVAVDDDLTLGVGQRADGALERGHRAVGLDGPGGDVVGLFEDRFLETRHKDVVAQLMI